VSTPESTSIYLPWATLCQSRLYPPVRDLGFGLWKEGRIQPWDVNGNRVEGRRERGLKENGGMELHGEWLLERKVEFGGLLKDSRGGKGKERKR